MCEAKYLKMIQFSEETPSDLHEPSQEELDMLKNLRIGISSMPRPTNPEWENHHKDWLPTEEDMSLMDKYYNSQEPTEEEIKLEQWEQAIKEDKKEN